MSIKKNIKKAAKEMPLPEWLYDAIKNNGIKICDECGFYIKDKAWIVVEDKENYHCECFYKNYKPIKRW